MGGTTAAALLLLLQGTPAYLVLHHVAAQAVKQQTNAIPPIQPGWLPGVLMFLPWNEYAAFRMLKLHFLSSIHAKDGLDSRGHPSLLQIKSVKEGRKEIHSSLATN